LLGTLAFIELTV